MVVRGSVRWLAFLLRGCSRRRWSRVEGCSNVMQGQQVKAEAVALGSGPEQCCQLQEVQVLEELMVMEQAVVTVVFSQVWPRPNRRSINCHASGRVMKNRQGLQQRPGVHRWSRRLSWVGRHQFVAKDSMAGRVEESTSMGRCHKRA